MGWLDWFRGPSVEDVADAVAERLEKARQAPAQGPTPAPLSYNLDPWDPHAYLSPEVQGLHNQDGLPPDYLRAIARSTPIVSATIGIRVNQIADYCVPQPNPRLPGFRIAMRDGKARPNTTAEKRIDELMRWTATCGDPRLNSDPTLETWTRKVMRDSMTIDRACSEIVRTRGGQIAGFIAVDAATILRAQISEAERQAGYRKPDETGYVQVINSKIVAEYSPDRMMFGIRRPRTDLRVNGYGFPELEELVRTVTQLLNAETYNANNFTNGVHAAGVLVLKSKMQPELFRAFQRMWTAVLEGAAKSRKMPLLQLSGGEEEDLKHIALSQNNKEMEFREWINFLIKMLCAVFGIDPAEHSMVFGNEGQSSSLSSSGPGERIIYSKERTLFPTLRALQGWINRSILYPLAEDFEFQFTGLSTVSEMDRLALLEKLAKTYLTVNEVRALDDRKPLKMPEANTCPADWGPMDATYFNAITQAQAAAQAAQNPEGADPEGEGEPQEVGGQDAEGLDEEPDLDAIFGDRGKDGADDTGGEPAPKPGKPGAKGQDGTPPAGKVNQGEPVQKGRVVLSRIEVEV